MAKRTMRCHYEVLQLERSATASEIKTSYYKLARVFHPDKNIGKEAEAEEAFKEIQAAYEVLSDPQEKAWYDSHREQILRGGVGGADDDEFDGGLNLWPYFSRTCYEKMDDAPEGFFGVYSHVFATLVEEEEQFGDTKIDGPSFGHSKSDYAQVRDFYNFWTNFSSAKSFSWHDKYRNERDYNRATRRYVDKENKKERDKARKAFNDIVRRLALYIKKNDPRVKAEMARMAVEAQERAKEAEEERLRKREAAKKAKEQWQAEQDAYLDELDLEELGVDEEETEESEPEFYCAACKKKFRSAKQWKNHEKSKKHKSTVEALRKEVELEPEIEEEIEEMEKERDETGRDEEEKVSGAGEEDEDGSGGNEEGQFADEEGEDDYLLAMMRNQMQKKQKKQMQKNKKRNAVLAQAQAVVELKGLAESEESHSDRKEEEQDDVEEREGLDEEKEEDEPDNSNQPPQGDNGKKARRRRKGKNNKSVPSTPTSVNNATSGEEAHYCVVCKSTFDSRNKLFKHIKKTGHAVPM